MSILITAILILVSPLIYVFILTCFHRPVWPEDYHPRSLGPVTWKQLWNPWWWTLNSDDPITLPKNDKHFPDDKLWIRKVKWWIRNPTCNFRRYIVGYWNKKTLWTRERRDNRGWTTAYWNGKDNMWPLAGGITCSCMPWIVQDIKLFGMWFRFNGGWKPNGEWTPGAFRRKR